MINMSVLRTYNPPEGTGTNLEFFYQHEDKSKIDLHYGVGAYITLHFRDGYTAPSANDELVLDFGGIGSTTIHSTDIRFNKYFQKAYINIPCYIAAANVKVSKLFRKSFIDPLYIINSKGVLKQLLLGASVYEEVPDIITCNLRFNKKIKSAFVAGGQVNDLPSETSSGFVVSYSGDVTEDIFLGSQFNRGIKTDKESTLQYDNGTFDDIPISMSSVINMPKKDLNSGIFYDSFFVQDKKYLSVYINTLFFFDSKKKISWEIGCIKDHLVKFPYLIPSPKDLEKIIKWGGFVKDDLEKGVNYTVPTPTELPKVLSWGPFGYSEYCKTKYFSYPADQIKMKMAGAIDDTNTELYFGWHLDLYCPYQYWYSGGRDQPDPITPPIPAVTKQGVYYMLNSLFVQRLPDHTNIDVSQVSMQTDVDSWLWSFQLTLTNKAHLDLIKPQGNDTFINIAINCNGWVWICKVESWKETSAFGKKTWTVSGRSPSAILSEPYDLRRVFTNSSDIQAEGLVSDLVSGSGFSISWDATNYYDPAVDWNIPAGVFSISDSTTIGAIQNILEACNAYIFTAPDTDTDPTLYIKPRYQDEPWKWAGATPTLILEEAFCSEIGRGYTSQPIVNAVIVSGQNAGIICSATKDGSAGDKPAPMVIHPLITTLGVGKEKARHILDASGNWVNHTLKLFSLESSGTNPGLVLPGTFIQFNEGGASWKGYTTGVSITAGWNNGLIINQVLEVEQYYE